MTRGVKNKAGGQWTTARYFSFIRSALRRASTRYPVKFQALQDNRRPYEGTDKRTKWEYQCKHCEGWFKTKEIDVDHTVPCGTLKDYDDLPGFCERLFCEPEDLQILCKPCHLVKTNEEKKK